MPPRKNLSRPVKLADVERAALESFFAETVIQAPGRLLDRKLLHCLYLDWRDRRTLDQPEESYPILTLRVFCSHVPEMTGAEEHRTTQHRVWRGIALAHPLMSERVTHLTLLQRRGSDSACALEDDWEPPSPLATGATPAEESLEVERATTGGASRPPDDPWGRVDYYRRKLRHALLKERAQRAALSTTLDRIVSLASSLAHAEASVIEASSPQVRSARLRARGDELRSVLAPNRPAASVESLASGLLAVWDAQSVVAFVAGGMGPLLCRDETCAHAEVAGVHAHLPWDASSVVGQDDPALQLICQGWTPREVSGATEDPPEVTPSRMALVGRVARDGIALPPRPSEPSGLLRRAIVRCPLCPVHSPWEYAGPTPEAGGTFFRLHLGEFHSEVVVTRGAAGVSSLVSEVVQESRRSLEAEKTPDARKIVLVTPHLEGDEASGVEVGEGEGNVEDLI